jgi:dolichol-phosphate mannosyltransferase
MKVAVVVPTYNERNNIMQLVKSIKHESNQSNEINVVVVDDNSPDGTADIVRHLSTSQNGIYLISRAGKMGLGSAYIDAFKWILDNLPVDVVVQMDADLSHPPELIENMIYEIQKGADAVIASRYSGQGGIDGWPLHRRIISKGANLLAKLFLGIGITDVTSGYRAFRLGVVEDMLSSKLSGKGYEYQVESIYILSKMNKRIEEVPFVFRNRTEGKSKLTLRDILSFIRLVINLKLHPPVNNRETVIAINDTGR